VVDIRTAVVSGGAGAGASGTPSGTPVDVLVRPEGLAVTPSPHGRGIVMTTTFLGSITRLGVLLDEDVMVYADVSNSAVAVPTGSAVEVTLTERAVMVSDRTQSDLSVQAPLEAQAPDH
jgi:putative spermidine/putrescine transport system ATP-binding protein